MTSTITDTVATTPAAVPGAPTAPPRTGPVLRATGISARAGGQRLLHDVSLDIAAGELVAVIGASGAGKTTLLETLAGLRAPVAGTVRLGGTDVTHAPARAAIGVVPQDDIIHRDLPLRRTLEHAARLRAGRGTSAGAIDELVDSVLGDLDLAGRAEVRVRDLSGGQRKRASIAVELLGRPNVLFLDEPTSGLDPATAAEVVAVLRRLASSGTAVVFTTHAPADVEGCDRVVALAPGGRLAFEGEPSGALRWFRVDRMDLVHAALSIGDPAALADRFTLSRTPRPSAPEQRLGGLAGDRPATMPSRPRQLAVLTRRNAELMMGNPLTLAILVGAPALVIGMLVLLFRPDGFEPVGGDPVAAVQAVYWIAFAGFFFGLTYGLLQIVTESSVFRRERFWGVSVTAYVGSKALVLLPVLVAVDVVLFGLLHATDRLPTLDATTWTVLGVAFLLDAVAGLALGLLTSAAVRNPAQATLALPMLCFPQVLFAGATVPVSSMSGGGRAISEAMSNRWAFEALGRLLELDARFGAALGDWAPAFTGTATLALAGLATLAVGCLVATATVLGRQGRTNLRR